MKVLVHKPVEIDVRYCRIEAAVRYEDEDMPYDFPGRSGDLWDVKIDLDTGKVVDWPEGLEYSLCMKVCDSGSYTLLDRDGVSLYRIQNDYVPSGLLPDGGGDYIEMQIRGDGSINGWRKPDLHQSFFNQHDC